MSLDTFSRIAGYQALVWWLGESSANRLAWNMLAAGRYLTKVIRKIRIDRGYSQRELATRAGVSITTIARLELYLNDAASASLRVLEKISKGLGCAFVIELSEWEKALVLYRSEPKVPAEFDANQLAELIT